MHEVEIEPVTLGAASGQPTEKTLAESASFPRAAAGTEAGFEDSVGRAGLPRAPEGISTESETRLESRLPTEAIPAGSASFQVGRAVSSLPIEVIPAGSASSRVEEVVSSPPTEEILAESANFRIKEAASSPPTEVTPAGSVSSQTDGAESSPPTEAIQVESGNYLRLPSQETLMIHGRCQDFSSVSLVKTM